MLFKTTEDLKNHISINNTFRLGEVKPSYLQAVKKFIHPAVGRKFLNELETIYAGAEPIDPKVQELLSLLQDTLAHYTFFLYSPINQVQIAGNGTTEYNGTNATPARQWVITDLKKSLLDSGDTFLDAVLEYLEDNSEEEKFKTWKESEYYTRAKDLFINNADELSRWTNVQSSRRTFLSLKPYLAEAERFYIKPTLGEDFYNELKKEIRERTVTEKNQIILDKIKPAAAQLGILQAIPKVLLKITSEGIRVDSFNNGIIKQDPASDNLIGALSRSLEVDGNSDLVLMKEYLIAHADDYPTFKESKVYKDTLPEERTCRVDWNIVKGYGV